MFYVSEAQTQLLPDKDKDQHQHFLQELLIINMHLVQLNWQETLF